MKKILFCMQALVASLLLTACLHDDNEVFDESAAQRIEKAVTADKALLESAPNGWELHLWTEPKYTGGGYTGRNANNVKLRRYSRCRPRAHHQHLQHHFPSSVDAFDAR